MARYVTRLALRKASGCVRVGRIGGGSGGSGEGQEANGSGGRRLVSVFVERGGR